MNRRSVVGAATLGLATVSGCSGVRSLLGSGDSTPPQCSGTIPSPERDALGNAPGAWTQPSGSARNAGVTSAAGAPDRVEQVWSKRGREFEQRVDARFGATPSLDGSPVIVTEDELYLTSSSSVHALDVTSGDHRWTVSPSDAVAEQWPPVLADGLVVFLATEPERLVAVDRRDRTVAWERPTAEWGVLARSRPTVAGDRILVPTTQGLVAFDAGSGRRRWGPKAGPDEVPLGTPAASADTVYAVGGGAVLAFDRADGGAEWTTPVDVTDAPDGGHYVLSGTVVGDDHVLVSKRYRAGENSNASQQGAGAAKRWDGNAHLLAFDRASGEQQWSHPFDGANVRGLPAVRDGVVFAAGVVVPSLSTATERTGFVAALDESTGCRYWWTEPFDGTDAPYLQPTASADAVYVSTDETGAATTTVYSLDPTDGTKRWSNGRSGDGFASRPVVAGESLYLTVDRESGSSVVAYSTADR